jgi:acetyl-CoA acetyltransferase
VSRFLENQAIISGVGLSEGGRRLGRPSLALALDAATAAISDAGLGCENIDGIATMGDAAAYDVKDALGIPLTWVAPTGPQGPGGHLRYVVLACLAVASGLCRHVLVYRSVSMLGGQWREGLTGDAAWHIPFNEFTAASMVAMHMRRYMHDYGATREQIGAIAVTARGHAALNDQAALRAPITIEDYLGAEMIADPVGLLDCDIPIDGAVALVVSHADHAPACRRPPVRFEAIGSRVVGKVGWDQRADYPAMAHTDAAAHMWSRTDLTPADVDVAELYDGFAYLALSWLEALGFCKTGEGGAFVEGGGRIRLGGELPLNTYGGQLSAGRLHGYWLLHEAVLQLQGRAGPRQVPGAEVAVAAAGGGASTGCLLLTGTR